MMTPSDTFRLEGMLLSAPGQRVKEKGSSFGLTCFCHLVNRDPKFLGHVSQNREDGKPCQDAGDGIAQGHYEGVPIEEKEDALNMLAP